jgi:multiple sugar transport system substrate-binding protein
MSSLSEKKTEEKQVSRRTFIAGTGAALVVGAVLGGAAGYLSRPSAPPGVTTTVTVPTTVTATATATAPPTTSAVFDLATAAKPYSGSTINVSCLNYPTVDSLKAVAPTFTGITGINVSFQLLGMDDLFAKQTLDLQQATGSFDVLNHNFSWLPVYASKLQDLSVYYNDPTLTDQAAYDMSDYLPIALKFYSNFGGKMLGLPVTADWQILVYRTDVFNQNGITAPPDTWDDFASIAQKVTSSPLYGAEFTGLRGTDPVWEWLYYLRSYGVAVIDENFNPVFNSSDGINATQNYVNLYKKPFTLPSSTGLGYAEYNSTMQTGLVAMAPLMWISALPPLLSPSTSKVAGKLGFALPPSGGAHVISMGGWGLSIPANSPNKEAAWLFISWATNPQIERQRLPLGGAPARVSILQDPSLQQTYAWFPIVQKMGSLNIDSLASDGGTLTPKWFPVIEPILEEDISAAISGTKSVSDALNDAASRIKSGLASS